MAVHLPPFDPTRDFVAQAPFRFLGHAYTRGLPFDKDLADERRLRQLYEQRRITYADTPRGASLLTGQPSETPTVPEVVRPRRAAPQRRQPKAHPLDRDENGRKGGSKPKGGGTEEQRVKRLVGRHNHAELFNKARGLAGVTQDMTKKQIATALVRHDRDGD